MFDIIAKYSFTIIKNKFRKQIFEFYTYKDLYLLKILLKHKIIKNFSIYEYRYYTFCRDVSFSICNILDNKNLKIKNVTEDHFLIDSGFGINFKKIYFKNINKISELEFNNYCFKCNKYFSSEYNFCEDCFK